MATITVQPAASSDDANQNVGSGNVALDDSTSIIQGNNHTGWRFPNVTIPQGSTINSAKLYFDQIQDAAQSDLGEVTFYGEDTDNASSFVATSGNISSRPRTTASISPSLSTSAFWEGSGATGLNVASIIQEVIDRSGWSSGNALALLCIGTGGSYRYVYPYAYDYSDHSKRARLVIDYTAPGGGTETASVTPVQLGFTVQNVAATFVASAAVTALALAFTVQDVTATYVQVNTASVDPVQLALTVQDVTAAGTSGAIANPGTPPQIAFTVRDVTATHHDVATATQVPLAFTIQDVDANYDNIGIAVVTPVQLALTVQNVTAAFSNVNVASVTPVQIAFRVHDVAPQFFPTGDVSDVFKTVARNPLKANVKATIIVHNNDSETEPTIITESDDLVSFKVEGNGALLKSSMRKLSGKLSSNNRNLVGEFVRPSFGLEVSEGVWEYISYGSFLITEQTSNKENGTMTFMGYDRMVSAYTKYAAVNHSYPCSLSEFFQQVCDAIGVENGMIGTAFINDDLEMTELYENITDVTYRDILDDIAEATCSQPLIGRDDKLYLKSIIETDEELDDTLLKKLKLEPSFGYINSVILSRMPTNDNIAMYEGQGEAESESESESESEGEPIELTEVKIINNEILDKRRQETIASIYNGLFGLAFTPFDATTIGLGWYEIGDRVTVENAEQEFSCVILNYSIEVDGSIKERLYTNVPSKTSTDYQRAGDIIRHLYNTEITVDKQQQFIESLVSDMYGEDGLVNESFTQILQDLTQVITSVQNAGGNNLLKNSACYMLDNDQLPVSWTPDITGSLTIEPSAEAQAKGSLSGNIIKLVDAKLTQRVSVKPDSPEIAEANKTYYSFAVKVKKSLVGTGYVKLSNALEEHLIEFDANDEADYATYEFKGLLPLQDYYDVEVYGDADSDFTVTDMVLTVGAYSQQWQQANGEFANTQVQINVDGVTVRSSTFLGTYTTMTPLAFSGYKDGELVFSIDVNGLQVKKALIAETITMQPIKLVKMTGGIAFVPGTEE